MAVHQRSLGWGCHKAMHHVVNSIDPALSHPSVVRSCAPRKLWDKLPTDTMAFLSPVCLGFPTSGCKRCIPKLPTGVGWSVPRGTAKNPGVDSVCPVA